MDFPSFLSLKPASEEPADWAWLPENILFIIITQLFLLTDMINFGCVCLRWNSVLKHRLRELNITPNMTFIRDLPMLLIPTTDSSTRNLYSLPDAAVYDLKLSLPYNNRCIGSSHGWLIFIDSLSFAITLFNPFYFGSSKGTIHLPVFQPAAHTKEMIKQEFFEQDFFADYFICKAVLSSDPISCPEDFILMLIHGEMRCLAFCKSGVESWIYMYSYQLGIFDIIYHEKYFLAVNFWGEIYVCDVQSNCPSIKVQTEPVRGPVPSTTRRYIARTDDGTILQAVRLVESSTPHAGEPKVFKTTGFKVYILEERDNLLGWIPVKHIDDGALFVGDNHSTYVKASQFPGIISNSIYFIDDYCGVETMYNKPYQYMGHCDSGIFNIETNLIFNHHFSNPFQRDVPPPIWLLPTL